MKNKNMLYKLATSIVFLLVVGTGTVGAQQADKGVNIVAADLYREGDMLRIAMKLDLQQLHPGAQNEIVLTPTLVGGDNRIQLPEILVYSHTRYKVYKRSMALEKDQPNLQRTAYTILKTKKEREELVDYNQSVPYEDWMKNSQLVIEGDVCGCGQWEPLAEQKVAEILTYDFQPKLAYIQPDREVVKKRKEDTEVFIDFKVNQAVIRPDLMNNRAELESLNEALRLVSSDENLTVHQIDIIGYASPEGSVAVNENLSKRRAEELKNYLFDQAHFPADIYNVKFGGENWEGLEKMLEESSLENKAEILAIIRQTPDVNARKNKLKIIERGRTYNYMLTNFYPKLRKTVVDIHYEIRNFTVEEAKEILNTRPEQLSLNEMFQLARTYSTGSAAFTEVFEKAVVMYPDSRIANLNAGAAALSAGNMLLAKKYLDNVDDGSAEYLNNMGVYYYLNDDLPQAKAYFTKAGQAGSEVGKQNLDELNKKIKQEKIPL